MREILYIIGVIPIKLMSLSPLTGFRTCEAQLKNYILSLWTRQADIVPNITSYDLIAQRNLAERARLLIWHSSAEGRIGSGAIWE